MIEFFKNSNPITLELACGKGEYSVGLAERYPNKNFIGIDIKGARFWRGAKTAVANELHNVAFLRTRIELLDHFFAPNEVDTIWITFPDPHLRRGDEKNRLTAPRFIELYRRIAKPTATINLKTDDPVLHSWSAETCAELGATSR